MSNPNPVRGPLPHGPGRGRPKGSPNKTTAAVKDALLKVYAKRGGDKALLAFSQEYPVEFYRIWGRMLPTEVSGDINVTGLDAIANRLGQALERIK